jgi:predicted dehydrogenase
VIVNWDNGVTSYIESGWWQPHSDGPEAATQLYGKSGFGQLFPTLLEIPNPQTNQVETVKSGFKFPRKEHCSQSMYDAQMRYFLHCAETSEMPSPGWREGLVNIQVVDAVFESSRTGQVVKVAQ